MENSNKELRSVKKQTCFDAYFDALVQGNRLECEKLLRKFREDDLSIPDLYEEIFKTSLYRIGELWEYNKTSVAVEHMATCITEGLMNQLFPEIISLDRIQKKVVISCVENEEHQVGGKMVADIFEMNGWDAHYLGANTPIQDLIHFCHLTKPDVIGLSLSVFFNLPSLVKTITALKEVTDTPIIIGGQALQNKGEEIAKKFSNVYYLASLSQVEAFIKGEIK